MRSTRVPDRVHVVRTPEQNTGATNNTQSIEIVRMLAQISDKLKRSEAERYELLNELREYRKSLSELEDKTDNSEKAYLALENKFKTKGNIDTESLQRQAKFEKTLRSTEEKMVKTIAGQALIDKRLSDTENRQAGIDQRLDQSVTEQARLDRQLELTSQDKARMLRKVERLEEIVTETQDTLRSKAMVLLTDQSAAQGRLSAPAWGEGSPQYKPLEETSERSFWQRAASLQTVGMGALMIAALLGGYAINQVQQPKQPQINIAETDNFIAPASTLSDVNNLETQKIENRLNAEMNTLVQDAALVPDTVPESVLDYSDDQLMQALNNDPEELASKLNDIEPAAADASVPAQEAVATPSIIADAKITEPMKNFETLAYIQNLDIQKAIKSEKPAGALSSRVSADLSLPATVKSIEAQALAGKAEAQHDLAAIYTAGQGGVNQNFEKAAFWFRESSEQNIANARYNLGVLNHQGLGMERDLDRALYWYREAARLGHAEAQYNLGIAHIEGIGTNYNPRLAAAFFERAANNGIMEAAYNLGLIYENGLLGTAKPDEALLWYKIAAEQGSPDAKAAMGQLATTLQIGMDDVDNLVERMQQINQSVKGRRAGPSDLKSGERASSSNANSTQAVVAQVQEYLMLTGTYAGPADGINGPKTIEAIKSYQATNDLKVTGKPSVELLNSMVGGALESLNR
jgi:TPR repeat protein